jgi:hypothetical protein
LPLATLRLHQAGSGLYLKYVSLFQIAPFSSRALPGTQQITGDGLGKTTAFFKSINSQHFKSLMPFFGPLFPATQFKRSAHKIMIDIIHLE